MTFWSCGTAQERAHPADRGLLDQALRTVVPGDGPVTVTVRARHANGSWRWLETTLSALLAADGMIDQQGIQPLAGRACANASLIAVWGAYELRPSRR